MAKPCCGVGVAGKTRSSVFARLSCRWCSFIHAEKSARQPEIHAEYRWIIWSKWEIELCVISIAMVGYTMCLYDGTQWCSVYGEEEGSKNRSLRNPSDQLMCSGFLPSPGHLEGPAGEIGFKPAKWNPVMPSDVRVARRIWWLTVSKAAGRSSRMRLNDLESAFAIRKASVTESSSVLVEFPCLISRTCCRMAGVEKFGYFGLHEGTEGEEGSFINGCGWFDILRVWSWELATDLVLLWRKWQSHRLLRRWWRRTEERVECFEEIACVRCAVDLFVEVWSLGSVDFSRERWKQRLIDTQVWRIFRFCAIFSLLPWVRTDDHEEHGIARSLKGQHVLAWRREDICGLDKKLKWNTKFGSVHIQRWEMGGWGKRGGHYRGKMWGWKGTKISPKGNW